MRYLSLKFTIFIFLTGCSSATIQPSASLMPTGPLTDTPRPTATLRPTATATPMLPQTIKIIFSENLSEDQRDQLEIIVNEAYWFYVDLGCSPEGYQVTFYDGEGGYAEYVNGLRFEAGIADFQTEPSVVSTAISHETAHIMCQIAYTRSKPMGAIDLRWLTEGVANYFSAMEQIKDTGMNSGVKFGSIEEHDRGMARSVSENFCQIPISALEPSNAQDLFPEGVYTVADVATRLLVKSTPQGVNAIIDYYKLLATTAKEDAFRQAFGRPKEDFYQQYEDECSKGFPTVIK